MSAAALIGTLLMIGLGAVSRLHTREELLRAGDRDAMVTMARELSGRRPHKDVAIAVCRCLAAHDWARQPARLSTRPLEMLPSLDVRFEPVPLSQSEPQLIALWEAGRHVAAPQDRSPDNTWAPLGAIVFPVLLTAGLLWVIWPGLLVLLWPTAAGVVLGLLASSWSDLFPAARPLLVLTGGAAQWDPQAQRWEVFRPDHSALVLDETSRGRWRWYIAQRGVERIRTGYCSPIEADVLLRAWLSPFPPPTPEQIASLA